MEVINIVESVSIGNHILNVYSDVDAPLFKATEVAEILCYSYNNLWKMLKGCEVYEKLTLPVVVSGQIHNSTFITELGLYNLLAQSRMPIARSWRRVVHEQLIKMRKDKMMNVVQQFEEWSKEMNDIYFDEETGALMRSVTLPGGDVEQVPVE